MSLNKVGAPTSESEGGVSFTQNHFTPVGTERALLVTLLYPDEFVVNSITYDGVEIPHVATFTYGAVSTGARLSWFYLPAPSEGNNNIAVTMSGNVGSMSIHAQSFDGANDLPGNYASNGLSDTPHSRTLDVSQNSLVMCTGISIYAFSTEAITIDGNVTSADNCDFAEAAFVQVRGHVEDTNLNAGTITCITDTIADSFQATNASIEILAASAVPVSKKKNVII